MKSKALESEKEWRESTRLGSKPLPPKHHFAHNLVRSKLCDTLLAFKCNDTSSILEVGCGTGENTVYVQQCSANIVGVDVSEVALKGLKAKGFQGILADVRRLPFTNDSFDYVISTGLLHHLVGQGNLAEFLNEFNRVTKKGGYVIALEPNLFNHSGLLMTIFNSIKPGITGLVPHERALSPLYLVRIFRDSGLGEVGCIAASYVWNRYPLSISKFISRHEERLRKRKPFSLLGWWEIVYGRKNTTEETK